MIFLFFVLVIQVRNHLKKMIVERRERIKEKVIKNDHELLNSGVIE